jgi:hypothetical protein
VVTSNFWFLAERTRNQKPETEFLPMTGIAVYARLPVAVTIYAPAHGLIDLAAQAAHLAYLAVTDGAIKLGPHVRLVREKDVGIWFEPVDADPGGLLASRVYSSQLLNFRAFSLDRIVTDHTGADIGYSSVRPACGVLVTERAIYLRAVFFRDVLMVVELYGLARRIVPA